MSLGAGAGGVRPEQGPPLVVPASFFVLAPIAMVAAGVFLFLHDTALTSRWLAPAMVLTHIGTLGLLAPVMLGALYQMLPVVAGSPAPLVRLAHVVHATLVVGLLALLTGFQTDLSAAFAVGGILLGVALTLFLLQVGVALYRAQTKTAMLYGMRLAVTGLALTVGVGLILARFRYGVPLGGNQLTWGAVHFSLGSIVWVGGLITAISWQVVPMFYLTDPYPRWQQRLSLGAIGLTAIGLLVALILDLASPWVTWIALPGAVTVWLLNPAVTVILLWRRRRARIDWSLRFWYVGLAAGVLLVVVLFTIQPSDYPHSAALIAWTAIWGWAGMIMHGMLTRIVPFLVWFHLFSKLVGKTLVPTMQQLLPPGHVAVAFTAHVATLVVGWVAIVLESPIITRATAVGLIVTGVMLATELARVLRPRRIGGN